MRDEFNKSNAMSIDWLVIFLVILVLKESKLVISGLSQVSTQTHINVDHIHSIIQYVFDVMS